MSRSTVTSFPSSVYAGGALGLTLHKVSTHRPYASNVKALDGIVNDSWGVTATLMWHSYPRRLSSTVLGGLKSIVTNFLGVAGQLSGPVAIVAAGSEIAKTDSAGLFQVRLWAGRGRAVD